MRASMRERFKDFKFTLPLHLARPTGKTLEELEALDGFDTTQPTDGVATRRRGWLVRPWNQPDGRGSYAQDNLCTQCCCGVCCCAGEWCNPSKQTGANFGLWALCCALLAAAGLVGFLVWIWIELDDHESRLPSPPLPPPAPLPN